MQTKSSGIRLFGPIKPKLTCTRMIVREQYKKGKEGLLIQSLARHLSEMVKAVLWHEDVWLPMDLGHWCLLMI